MNGPLGDYASRGNMRGMAVLRSHGGRYQAVQDGDVHIDIAVIAAPTADAFGNANGVQGPSACGLLGFALAGLGDIIVGAVAAQWVTAGRGLVDVVGRDEGLGRPLLYGTTPRFLEHFGLKGLSDLPPAEEFPVELGAAEDQPVVEPAREADIEAEVEAEIEALAWSDLEAFTGEALFPVARQVLPIFTSVSTGWNRSPSSTSTASVKKS